MLGFIVLIMLTQDHAFPKTAHIYALQHITEPLFFLRYLTLKIRLIFTLNYACAHKRSTKAILYEIWHQQCLQSDESNLKDVCSNEKKWRTQESLPDFPRLILNELRYITLGVYQLKQAKSYTEEYISIVGMYSFLVHKQERNIEGTNSISSYIFQSIELMDRN